VRLSWPVSPSSRHKTAWHLDQLTSIVYNTAVCITCINWLRFSVEGSYRTLLHAYPLLSRCDSTLLLITSFTINHQIGNCSIHVVRLMLNVWWRSCTLLLHYSCGQAYSWFVWCTAVSLQLAAEMVLSVSSVVDFLIIASAVSDANAQCDFS